MCEWLQHFLDSPEQLLIINIPPRFAKSNIGSISFPAWVWKDRPHYRFIFSSHGQDLADSFAVKRRDLIKSPYYQNHWGDKFKMKDDKDTKRAMANDKGGEWKSTSTDGSVGGFGADIIVVDDPQDPLKPYSESDRLKANAHVRMITTRLNDPNKSKIIVIMQRIHHVDATAEIEDVFKKEGKPYLKIVIPAIEQEGTDYHFPISGRVVSLQPNDLIWPRFDSAALNLKRRTMGLATFAAQYFQQPSPEGGGIFQTAWWRYMKEISPPQLLLWIWDTAVKDTDDHDWSCGGLISIFSGRLEIVQIVRGKWKYPELKRMVRACQLANPAAAIVIEDKTSGQQLIQEFQSNVDPANPPLPVIAVMPKDNKIVRANLSTAIVESGQVFLLEDAPWLAGFLLETEQFPNGDHDDQVDMFSMASAKYLEYQGVRSGESTTESAPSSMGTYTKIDREFRR